jgi:hypothetical protein
MTPVCPEQLEEKNLESCLSQRFAIDWDLETWHSGITESISETTEIDLNDEEEKFGSSQTSLPVPLPALAWDGPDDPDNPMNWSVRKRVRISATISSVSLVW